MTEERLFSIPELAELWSLSESTVRRIVEKEPGVIRFLPPGGKRVHVRVPETVAARLYRSFTNPEAPPPRRRA
jgi:hypothetical protein